MAASSPESVCIFNQTLQFRDQLNHYKGKVRDVHFFEDYLVMVVSDRISAFDHILPRPIPYKGQVLNGIASHFLKATEDIVPNWLEDVPHPNVAIGKQCEPIRLEMVVRGHLTGHAWRTYAQGIRELCGVPLPEGMIQHEAFQAPIITPATKAETGHDEDISAAEILNQNIVDQKTWDQLCEYSLALFQRGRQMAEERGLILVDTKYEFGFYKGKIMLMDEIHTPDSSRYFYKEGFQEKIEAGQSPDQLSKEFVREWLMENGFQGKEGQSMPEMTDEFIWKVSERYRSLYEIITGMKFEVNPDPNVADAIVDCVNSWSAE